MRNVFRVLGRDLKRIAKAPASWVVLVVLIFLPSLYTWFNVVGFWDPYSNTGDLKVCVVNEDAGAENDLLGELKLGDQIVDTLHENTQLGWVFTDREDAMAKISSGEAYAAFVIPKDFSEDMTTLLTDDFQQPQLEYYVNEKLNPVAPKITDTGASTLDNTINDTFVSTVSSVVAEELNEKIAESQESFDASKANIASQISEVDSDLSEARASIAELSSASNDAISKANDAKSSLSDARREIADMALALSEASALAGVVNNDLADFSVQTVTALNKGLTLVSSASSNANYLVGVAAGKIGTAQGSVEGALTAAQGVVESNDVLIEQLENMDISGLTDEQQAVVKSTIATLKQANENAETNISSLDALSKSIVTSANGIADASNNINNSVNSSIGYVTDYNNNLSENTIPAVSRGLASMASTTGSLSGTVARQTSLIDQASVVLDQLISTLGTTTDALGQTSSLIGDVQGDIDTVQTDLVALSTSGVLDELFGTDGTLDVEKIADFMQSPTEVETEQLYPLNSYGSAMSPLFINLTLWIGVFMLMVILHLEVDEEGIKNLTIAQRYLARGILFAVMVSLQAVVCVTGCLALGVQAVNVPAFYVTAVACSLTYLSIQYALSTTLQHVGKGMCIILIFVQIPGATGLYPVELTTSFFQAVYPVFPFTYGINAMRECICGFYGNAWFGLMGMLALFFLVFLAIGVFARPYLTNLNRMFAKQLAATEIVNCEEVQLPERRYRTSQIIRAMSNHDEFRAYLVDHSERFMRMYPNLKRAAWVVGIAAPVVFTMSMALWSPGKKVVVLTVWLAWLIVVISFLIIIEHIKDSLERQAALNAMSDEELRTLFAARNSLAHDSHMENGAPLVGFATNVAVGPEGSQVRVPISSMVETLKEPAFCEDGLDGSSVCDGALCEEEAAANEQACVVDIESPSVEGCASDDYDLSAIPADDFDMGEAPHKRRWGRRKSKGGDAR